MKRALEKLSHDSHVTQAMTAARSTRSRRDSVPGASADTLCELEALRAHAEHLETLIEGSADIYL